MKVDHKKASSKASSLVKSLKRRAAAALKPAAKAPAATAELPFPLGTRLRICSDSVGAAHCGREANFEGLEPTGLLKLRTDAFAPIATSLENVVPVALLKQVAAKQLASIRSADREERLDAGGWYVPQ